MKHKLFALILALTVVAWTQTATQTPSAPAEKAKPSCCDKMSDAKDGHASCMRHGHGDAKDMASCCAGKDAKSCCGKDAKSCMKDDKTAAACCKDGCGKDKDKTAASCCDHKAGKECGKECCGSNKSEKPA